MLAIYKLCLKASLMSGMAGLVLGLIACERLPFANSDSNFDEVTLN
ncbi:hypothetical protein [Psychrobacter sp. H8-1]|nr:hypothetical protein [Psychrobacter sp. H8-1]